MDARRRGGRSRRLRADADARRRQGERLRRLYTFTGSYELDGDSITIGPLAATLMACEEEKSAAEAAYLPALEAADAWAIEDDELVLSSGGEETLRFGTA